MPAFKMKIIIKFKMINPFHALDLFWYPLKTSENQSFLMFSGGVKIDQGHEMD